MPNACTLRPAPAFILPVATLAAGSGGSFTISEASRSGILRPVPAPYSAHLSHAERAGLAPMPCANRDSAGPLSRLRLRYAGLSDTRESLFVPY